MAANTIGPQSPYLNAIRDPGYAAKRDRRKRVRTSVHWPVVFRSPANEVFETITQNLSSQGFYCLSSTPLASGQPLLCWVTVPTYDPTGGMSSVVLECDV